jgi:hypothetical protein
MKYGLHNTPDQYNRDTYSNENLIQEITNRVTANLRKEEEPKKVQYVELSKVESKSPPPPLKLLRPNSLKQLSN